MPYTCIHALCFFHCLKQALHLANVTTALYSNCCEHKKVILVQQGRIYEWQSGYVDVDCSVSEQLPSRASTCKRVSKIHICSLVLATKRFPTACTITIKNIRDQIKTRVSTGRFAVQCSFINLVCCRWGQLRHINPKLTCSIIYWFLTTSRLSIT